MSVGVVNAISINDFFKIFLRFSWFASSVFLLSNILKRYTKKHVFEIISYFFIHVAYLIILDVSMSFLINTDILIKNEGLKTFLLSVEFVKYASLVVIPFLVISGKRYWPIAVLILIFSMLGSRASIVSVLFSIVMSVVIILKLKKYYFLTKISVGIVSLIIILYVSLATINISRTSDITSPGSTISRVVIWVNYMSLLENFPFGMSQQGAVYYFKHMEFQNSNDVVKLLDGIVDVADVRRRVHVYDKKTRMPSEHSIHVSFLTSYGVVGIFIWLYLLGIMLLDFWRIIFYSTNYRFSIIYTSFSSMLILGIFNSFHTGWFFIVLFYYLYFLFRKESNPSNI